MDARAASVKALAPTKVNRSITGQKTTGTPQLLVDATGATPRLAWKVLSGGTQSDGTPSRLATYVDATTGAVLRAEQEIQTAEGSGQSLYSGTVPVQVTQSGSSYLLKDSVRGGSATSDMNNKEDSLMCQIFGSGCTNGTVFSSPDLSFGNGTNSNRESAGVDAAYGGAETFDYFKLVHGRNGIFGNGAGAPSRVHYGSGYVNAFWDGTKMTYGDGDGVDFGPLVSLDVAGHEMSHGVTENTANLTYSGESGGLNESTSDIFGTMVEFYANNANDAGDYLIGEEFDLTQHVGFRRMDKPSSDGCVVRLLQRDRRPGRRALLLGGGQPLLLPARRGLGRQDDRRGGPQLADLQRLHRDRHRSRRRREDLVPCAHDVHDLEHHLQRRPHRLAERRQGPLRRRQHAVQRRCRCLERRLGRLVPGAPGFTRYLVVLAHT